MDSFLKYVNTTILSNRVRFYTSNKAIILLITNKDFENGEVSIQRDSYLRIGEKLVIYISNNSRCKCVIYEDNMPETVGIYPNNTFNFILPTKSKSKASLLLKKLNKRNLISNIDPIFIHFHL